LTNYGSWLMGLGFTVYGFWLFACGQWFVWPMVYGFRLMVFGKWVWLKDTCFMHKARL